MGCGNPHYQYMLGNKRIEHGPVKKDLEVLVDGKLDMSQQCAPPSPESKPYPGLHQKKHSQQVEEGDPALLLCTHLEYCIQMWHPP